MLLVFLDVLFELILLLRALVRLSCIFDHLENFWDDQVVLSLKSVHDQCMGHVHDLQGQVSLHQTNLFFVTVINLSDVSLQGFAQVVSIFVQSLVQVLLVPKVLDSSHHVFLIGVQELQILVELLQFFIVELECRAETLDSMVHLSLQIVELVVYHVDDGLLCLETMVLEALGSHIKLENATSGQLQLITNERLHRQQLLFKCIEVAVPDFFSFLCGKCIVSGLKKSLESQPKILNCSSVLRCECPQIVKRTGVLLTLVFDDVEHIVDVF